MFRKTSGSILCPSCGRLTNADAAVCLVCGRRNPGMWGFAGPLRVVFRSWSFTNVVTAVCVVLFLATIVLDPYAALHPRGYLDVFAPSNRALQAFGMTGVIPWRNAYWWTIFTAIYLHGGLLHILFNLLWIRQLGPAVEEIYGPARLVIIFTVAGTVGFIASNVVDVSWLPWWLNPTALYTLGASGSIFGLLGAIIAYARKRGGAFGRLVLQQYGQWALILFIFGCFMPGVNNIAHAGGFIGGYAAGLGLSLAERRTESTLDWVLASAAIVITAVGFALALFTAFAG